MSKLLRACFVLCGLAACGGPTAWDPTLAPTSALYDARRGLRVARGPIHIHSPYSHDACDKVGFVDGVLDQTCLDDFRAGLCQTHQDFAMLTDHADFFAQQDWDATFLPGPGDEPVMVDGKHVASKLACPDGTSVLLSVGSENDLMPIGLTEHVADTPDARETILKGTDADAAAAMRAHGALIAVAHGESHDFDQLVAVQADVLEIYNLHANLGPDIRLLMNLDPGAPIIALFPFIDMSDPKLLPDMAFLFFWEENAYELGRLDSMWSSGRHVAATLGADAHENVVSGKFTDGERGDSYRRILRWFSNHLLVSEVTPAALRDALQKGRVYGAFEMFGSPVGFDFRAERSAGVAELGDTIKVADGATMVLEAPSAPGVSSRDVRLRILRVDASGSHEIAAGPATAPLQIAADAPGAYRAEVRITPRHLAPFLGQYASYAEHEFVWVYTSPIYVE